MKHIHHLHIYHTTAVQCGGDFTLFSGFALNEQAMERCSCIIRQMAEAEGITEELKARDLMRWVQGMNSIRSRAEEIIRAEMIYC